MMTRRVLREEGVMNVIDAIITRKSVRKYSDQPIEDEKLTAVLEAGRLAPSASNRQEWRFLVVRDPGTRAKLVDAANRQPFVEEAPAVIVACAETDGHIMRCGLPCFPIDVAIALDHITLAAVEVGLGTCWIGAFDEGAVKAILGIPEEVRVVALMPIGYPADPTAIDKKRRPFTTIVKYEHW
jgi:nitroreductase